MYKSFGKISLLGKKLNGIFQTLRRMLMMKEIQFHFRCIKPYEEIQRMNVIIIFPGGVGLPPSMDTRGKELEIHLKC